MSTFNLKLEYPDIDYSWYQVNSDKITPKCPANWTLEQESEFERYVETTTGDYALILNQFESVSIPFKTNNKIEDISISNRYFEFSHLPYSPSATYEDYELKIYWNDTDFITLTFPTSNRLEAYTTTVTLPNYVEYVKVVCPDYTDFQIYLLTNIDFNLVTSELDINTEQADFSINTNKRVSTTIDNTLVATTLKKKDVRYTGNLLMNYEEEKQLTELAKLSRLNKLLTTVNINIQDEAGANLANIPSGGAENRVKYYYLNHKRKQKTGLYSYVTLVYEKDNKSASIYI